MRQSDNNPAVNDIDTRVRESVRVNSPHQIEFKERVAFRKARTRCATKRKPIFFCRPRCR